MTDRDLSGRTLGEFILREQIGEGGYGVVYRGEQLLLKRDVVVKVLHERRSDRTSRMRFLREARLASLLDHPYAAHVYASGAEPQDGVLWIAMEWVQGVPLSAWLDQHGRMPPEQFVPFFECVAEVVHAAHGRGIVHRDLKPSNIMVVERGGRLFPRLLDFGIAKVSPQTASPASKSEPDGSLAEGSAPEGAAAPDPDDVETARLLRRERRDRRTATYPDSESGRRLTPSCADLGSRPYMAPEQRYRAERVGPEADIYSLGVVAYQTLTGRLPFSSDRTDELRQGDDAQPPRLLWPEIDDALKIALAVFPGDRQRSVLELASALRRALPASRREQLRSSAQQWEDRDRPPGLLWGADVLADVARQFPSETLGKLECSFVAESQRRARRTRWARRSLVALAAATAIGGFLYRASTQTRQATLQSELAQKQTQLAQKQTQLAQEQARLAREVTEATVTQAELEQGRSLPLQDLRGRVRPELQARARRRRGRGHRRRGGWPGDAGRRARRAAEHPGRALRPRLPACGRGVPGQHRPGLGRDPAVPSLELVAGRRQLRPELRA
jgi:serine/threonine protein kinase